MAVKEVQIEVQIEVVVEVDLLAPSRSPPALTYILLFVIFLGKMAV